MVYLTYDLILNNDYLLLNQKYALLHIVVPIKEKVNCWIELSDIDIKTSYDNNKDDFIKKHNLEDLIRTDRAFDLAAENNMLGLPDNFEADIKQIIFKDIIIE